MLWKKIKILFKLLFLSLKELIINKADVYAAGLAYFQMLSITPMVGFILYFFLKIYGEEKTKVELIPILQFWFPQQFIEVMKFILSYQHHLKPLQLVSMTWLAGLAFIWATKAYFAQVRDSIEGQWNEYKDHFGLKAAWHRLLEDGKTTLVSFLIILCFVILISFLPNIPQSPHYSSSKVIFYLIGVLRFLIGFLFLFSLILYFLTDLPPVKIKWTDAVPGALLGAILQIAGRQILKWHMAENPSASLPESTIVMMVWFFYSGMVLLHASEFSKLYILRKYNLDLSKKPKKAG